MENLIPKMVFTFIETKPEEETYEVCISLKNVCSAVATTTKILSDGNVDIRTSTLFNAPGLTEIGYWTSFIDMSKATKSVQEIKDALSKLEVVKEIRVVKPQPMAYDVIHFPILHGESPAMIMPIELFGSLFEEVGKILQPSGFAAVFYNAGKKSGTFIANLLTEKYALKNRQLILALVQSTRAIGWGQMDEVKVDLNRLYCKIRVRRCFEAVLKRNGKERGCYWTRGFLAGFLSQAIGKPMEAIELKCATGEDEFCDFEIKPIE